LVALAAPLAVVLSASDAHAQTVIVLVELKDGSSYQGDLVEKVPSDHVTIKLATGEIKRFDWSSIASTREGASAPQAIPAGELPVPDGTSLVPGGVGGGSAGALVDWPEPDRTPPPMMTSRLSFGFVGGVRPLGYGAIEGQYYPWNENTFTVGFRAAYGPWGALGHSVGEMLTVDWPLGRSIQQGLGVGLTQSFRAGPGAVETAGAPGSMNFFDADCSHFNVFLSRALMLHLGLGFSWATSSGCKFGEGCGRFNPPATLTFAGGLFWNLDTSPGDH
jgi:hypothetical protein